MFCENCNAGKAKLNKFCLLTLILLIEIRCNLTLTSRYGKFNQENMYQDYQNRLRFVKVIKTFWYVFVHSFNCCSLAKREC